MEQMVVPLPEQHTDTRLWDRMRMAGGLGVAGICLVGAGVAIGTQVPATAEISPGLSVSASLESSETTVDFGALGSIYLPAAHYHTPLGNVGAKLSVHNIGIDFKNPETLSSYAALKNGPEKSIKDPIVRAMAKNAGIGAGFGLAAEALLVGGYMRRRRRKRAVQRDDEASREDSAIKLDRLQTLSAKSANNEETTELIDSLRASLQPEESSNPHKRRRLLLGAAAGVAALALTAEILMAPPAPTTDRVALAPILTSEIPLLKGSSVSGSGAELLVTTAVTQVENYIKNTDAFYVKVNHNLKQAFSSFKNKPGDIKFDDPNYVNVLAISDYHCNLAMLQKSLNLIVRSGKADVIANMGDTSVSTGKLPSEQQCTDVMGRSIAPTAGQNIVPIVTIQGNHDSAITASNERKLTLQHNGKDYQPFVVLDDILPFTKVDGLVFASGANDPRQSVLGSPMTPVSIEDQNKVLAEQGATIAKNACKAKETYGVEPIVMAHGMEATYQSIIDNCASITMSGHLHVQKGPYEYKIPSSSDTNDFNLIYAFTQGTSSGAGEGQITEYSPITKKEGATYTFFMFNPSTNQPEGYYNLVIGTDASVKLSSFTRMPSPQLLPTAIPLFLTRYSANPDN